MLEYGCKQMNFRTLLPYAANPCLFCFSASGALKNSDFRRPTLILNTRLLHTEIEFYAQFLNANTVTTERSRSNY